MLLFFVWFQPSIFGTVASELTPKDGSSRKVSALYYYILRPRLNIFKLNRSCVRKKKENCCPCKWLLMRLERHHSSLKTVVWKRKWRTPIYIRPRKNNKIEPKGFILANEKWRPLTVSQSAYNKTSWNIYTQHIWNAGDTGGCSFEREIFILRK